MSVPRPSPHAFAHRVDDRTVKLLEIRSGAGAEVAITNYGARVVALRVPDRHGELADVVLGHDDLAGYLADPAYLGAVCGRCANRIGGARCEVDGRALSLAANEGRQHLHGGARGWDRVVWRIASVSDDRVVLEHESPDGDQGYPGTVKAAAAFHATARGLRITLTAETDRPTLVNLTHHGYFQLGGGGSVLDHELECPAERFLPTDAEAIPLGEERPVAGTPFDFRAPKPLGRDLASADPQLQRAGGYDHHLVLGPRTETPRFAARLVAPSTGRQCELWTTEPGLQLYTGNALPSTPGKGGIPLGRHAGVCLEPQLPPDAIHHAGFPSPILRPGQRYRHESEYRFDFA